MVDSTNVPWRRILPVVLSVFCYFFNVHVVMPFLPFMTKSFLDPPRNEIGYYAGFLASSFFIGDFVGSVFWGRVADRTGRRRVMLLSPALTTGAVIAFGLSQSFWFAVLTRLVWGFTGSLVSVAKTILADLSTDGNQARLFALMGVGNGLARLVAPALGGLLSRPARKFPELDVDLFRTFPYLLPCLIGVVFSLLNILINFLYLKETMKKKEMALPVETQVVVSSEANGHTVVNLQALSSSDSPDQGETIRMLVLNDDVMDDSGVDDTSIDSTVDRSSVFGRESISKLRDASTQLLARIRLTCKAKYHPLDSTCGAVRRHFQAYRLLKSPIISRPIRCYTLLAFTSMVTFEVLPLLLLNNSAHGGFCLNSAELGIIYAAAGVVQLCNQLLIYPWLARRFGYRRLFRIMLMCFSLMAIFLPWSVKIIGSQDPRVVSSENSTSNPKCAVLSQTTTRYINRQTSSLANNNSLITTFPMVSSFADITMTTTLNTHPGECYSVRGGVNGTADNEDLQSEFSLVSCIPWWVYMSLVAFSVPLTLSIIMSFTSSNIMMNNSCTADIRATVNGISQSFASVGRLLGPLFSIVFAWSTANNLTFPLNYHLIFWLIAVVNIINIFLSRKLTTVVEKRQVEERVPVVDRRQERRELLLSVGEEEEEQPVPPCYT